MNDQLSARERNELRIMELVEERDTVTQRGVATELEIAVGMANSLIKKLVHKGFIKIKEAPSRRYGYYLTPEGFIEKSRLVSKYIANSFKFFGQVRGDYEAIAAEVTSSQLNTVCCVGTGEVLEVAQMVFTARGVQTLCVLDVLAHEGTKNYTSWNQLPKEIESQIGFYVMTETWRPHKAYEIVTSSIRGKPLLAPGFMKIRRSNHLSRKI